MADRYTYTIADNNVVNIFDAERPIETGAPNIRQPFHPVFPDKVWTLEEAKAWAEATIDNLLNPVIRPEPVEEIDSDSVVDVQA